MVFVAGNRRAEMYLLNRHVTRQHAIYWDKIGLELGIERCTINNISKSNQGEVEKCFKDVLNKWLDNGKCTWGELHDAITQVETSNSVTFPIDQRHQLTKGNDICSCYNLHHQFIKIVD